MAIFIPFFSEPASRMLFFSERSSIFYLNFQDN